MFLNKKRMHVHNGYMKANSKIEYPVHYRNSFSYNHYGQSSIHCFEKYAFRFSFFKNVVE